jgi:hypothetical protein
MTDPQKSAPHPDVYRLSHRWLVDGPIDTVYYYLTHARTFPEWWPVFQEVQTDSAEVAVGAHSRFRVRSVLPYRLAWECIVQRDSSNQRGRARSRRRRSRSARNGSP